MTGEHNRVRPVLARGKSVAGILTLGVALAAGSSAIVAPSASADGSCWGGPTVTDYKGRTFATHTCPTWTGTGVYDAVVTPETSGYLYAGDNWMVCQKTGSNNPTFGAGGQNDYWLYTQGDVSYFHGGWGWIPATAVSYGGDWQPIPGVPLCPANFY